MSNFLNNTKDLQKILTTLTECKNEVLSVEHGGTGASDADTALANLSAQKKITGTPGQFVGFDENGNAMAQDSIDEFDLLLELPTLTNINADLTPDKISIAKGDVSITRTKVENGEPVRVAILQPGEYSADSWNKYMYASTVSAEYRGADNPVLHLFFHNWTSGLAINYWLGRHSLTEPYSVEYYNSYSSSALPIERGGTGATTAENARNNLGITAENIGAAPAYTYSQTDLTAGSSTLATGKLYFVYE